MTPTPPDATPSARLGSRAGVDALLASACHAHSAELIGNLLTPLFPLACPWKTTAELPLKLAQQHAPALTAIAEAVWAYRQTLTQSADGLRGWLDATDDDVRAYALRCAKVRFPGKQKLAWAVRVTGAAIPGKTPETQGARINDARFWRRAIGVRQLREREHFFLRLKLIGRGLETYVSEQQLFTRTRQLKQQAEWMQNTVLVPRYLECDDKAEGPLTLAKVASSPKTRFAKLYAFTRAMDEIATAQGLESGMLTLTLEPEWHPNPSHGSSSWNGSSPREGHQVMAKRWQSILRDLDRARVGLSGLRVVEPHKDGCPHWHLWLLYKPEVETRLLATVMNYFPGKLKIRAPSWKGQKHHPDDRIYVTRADLLGGTGRAPTHAKEGAQIELSRIDRSISSGASYAMKYLLKTVDASDKLNQKADLFGNIPAAELKEKQKKHQESAQRVDAYRSLWGINAGQLFGVAKCLSAWDELRRLALPPEDAQLRALWILARGSDKPGRISKNAGQRGNPRAFLEALGGLAASRQNQKPDSKVSIERLTVAATNGYGENIRRAKGISLVERQRMKVRKGQVDCTTGEIYQRAGRRSVKNILASVVTRLTEWILVSAPRCKKVDADFIAVQREAAKVAFDRTGLAANEWPVFLKNWARKTEPVMKNCSPVAYQQATLRAQERAHQRIAATNSTGLGKQAQEHFWSSLWAAWETLCPDERYPQVA